MTIPTKITAPTSSMSVPPLESHLPDLVNFIGQLTAEAEQGTLPDWSAVAGRVQTFFTPQMLHEVDSIVPGWSHMASYANQLTLIHVMLVFVSLWRSTEYLVLNAEQQAIMQWVVLFHDLGKKIHNGRGDFIHGFRSAVMAAQQLPRFGFTTTLDYQPEIEAWCQLTTNACVMPTNGDQSIQDNRKLPQILAGLDQLFGHNTPANLIVKTVLFHMSIDVVKPWPQAAPLSREEIARYIDRDLFPLLKTMMLIDNAAWTFFRPENTEQGRKEALTVFNEISRIIR